MSERIPTDRYFPAFDSLRTLGFVGIAAQHVNQCYPEAPENLVNLVLAMWFRVGGVCLELFFVLSGYLITGILWEARGKNGYFRNFYARRTLRIMPLYFAFLFFVIALSRAGLDYCPRIDGEQALAYGLYYSNFMLPLDRCYHPCLPHTWTLALEEHFYLLWPLAVWCLRRQTLMRLCVVVAVMSFLLRVGVIVSGSNRALAFFITPCRLDGLLAGSFVALAQKNQADWTRLRQWSRAMLVSSACVLLAIAVGNVVYDTRNYVVTVGIFAMAVFNAGLVVMLVTMKKGHSLGKVLENKCLCSIGKYTYGMYLFHYLILHALVASFPTNVSPVIAKLATLICVTMVSFVAAWASYHLFEKHFLRLKAFFEYRAPASSVVAGAQLKDVQPGQLTDRTPSAVPGNA